MAASPVFTATPNIQVGVVSAANTARDGSGTIQTCFTASANGSRVDRINIQATGVTTDGWVRIFVYDGSNYRLYKEVDVTPATPSATVAAFVATVNLNNFYLMGSSFNRIACSTHNAEQFIVTVMGSDL